MSHVVHYKGYSIIFSENMYHLALCPMKKFLTMQDIMKEIDWIEYIRCAIDNKKNDPHA